MLENPRILLLVAVSCALCVASCVQAAPRVLAKDAVARCGIVLAEEAGPVERHAADELARYLGQVSGARVTIQTTPQSDAFPIYLGTLDSRIPLSAAITARAALVAPQGFLLAVGDDGARILGRQPIGVLYGVYHLLKTTAGLRWFAPGAEFEYCPQTTTLTIADQLTVSNPSFRYRTTGFVCCNWNSKTLDTWDWLVRNGMTITVGSKVYQLYREELEKRGAVIQDGGHVFAELLSDELFDVHPEYFPLIDGKRRRQHEAGVPGWPQPCTSNPDVARIMTENLLRKLTPGGASLIGNNDDTRWCQCSDCTRLDPPDEQRDGRIGTRYFTLINQLARGVYARQPDAALRAWAYQNYQYPPTGVTPDPRLSIEVCVHYRCYRHALTDPSCAPNARMRAILMAWKKLPNTVTTREYDECFKGEPPYLPVERSFCADIRYYHALGLAGFKMITPPPDGIFGPTWNRRGVKEAWPATWQMRYLAAQLAWDVTADEVALTEDMGGKYYGKAWPAMKTYRDELTAMYGRTPGHICYETPAYELGRCLEKPGVEGRLLALLARAETLAKDDAVRLARIRRDREYFQLCWQALYQEYAARRSSVLHCLARTDEIAIDGSVDELAWQQAEYVTNFVETDTCAAAEPRTYVRLLHDSEHLYLAIEAMEPTPGQMWVKGRGRDGAQLEDNHIELFLVAPGHEGRCAHIRINSAGAISDALLTPHGEDTAFETGVMVKTRVLGDRWVAELRLPVKGLDQTMREGECWKISILRHRRLRDGTRMTSDWNDGALRSRGVFRPVILGRVGLLENGDLEDATAPSTAQQLRGWAFPTALAPAGWALHDGKPGTVELRDDEPASGQRYLRLTDGWIHARLNQPADYRQDLLITLQARGKGVLGVNLYRYAHATGKNLPTVQLTTVKMDVARWQPVVLRFTCVNDDVLRLALHVTGTIDVDDGAVTLEPTVEEQP